MTTVEQQTGSAIRPFRADVPEDRLADLRRRLAATRWPSRELVTDRSQGVQLATMQELVHYWATEHDWRATEAKLNALPQFMTETDGVDIHFLHVRSPHPDALPLIMTPGWPGSVVELLDAVGPLTDPTAYGGRAEDAFDLVLPSLPGYGFSSEPTEVGWDVARVGRAWAELMRRLGYTNYVAQGGDVGAGVTDAMGHQAPEGLLGIHTNLLVTALGGGLPTDSEQERAAIAALDTFRADGFAYFLQQATRPQTIGYALLDSPVALAAWMLDHASGRLPLPTAAPSAAAQRAPVAPHLQPAPRRGERRTGRGTGRHLLRRGVRRLGRLAQTARRPGPVLRGHGLPARSPGHQLPVLPRGHHHDRAERAAQDQTADPARPGDRRGGERR
jgi:hypothetical protein